MEPLSQVLQSTLQTSGITIGVEQLKSQYSIIQPIVSETCHIDWVDPSFCFVFSNSELESNMVSPWYLTALLHCPPAKLPILNHLQHHIHK